MKSILFVCLENICRDIFEGFHKVYVMLEPSIQEFMKKEII